MKHQAPPNHHLDRRDQAFAEPATPAPVHDQPDNDFIESQPKPTDPLARRVYALSDAGLIFGRSTRTMRWWADAGRIRTIKIGKTRFVAEAEIQRLLSGEKA